MAGEDKGMLAHYRIAGKLGEGGMGVVWKAVDTHLDREVAIKVLPPELAQDPDRLSRFEREARVLASLNHRNVAAIYGIEHQVTEQGVSPVLVLEYVPGETLAELIKQGPLPLDDALDAAAQIAEGLEAAHEIGIIHRDLKPANVKLTPDGRAKILDFGLAKAFAPEAFDPFSGPSRTDIGNSPTITTGGTRLGAIIGTAAYMCPEQARGKAVDKRADIWSFGCLLFECLAGTPPFPGETATDVLGAILHLEPDWTALPEATPARVRDLLRRCLDKDARKRLRDIGDARIELQEASAARISSPNGGSARVSAPGLALPADPGAARAVRAGAASKTAWPARALWLALGLALGATLWGALGPRGGSTLPAPRGPVSRVTVEIPDTLEIRGGGGLTADGRAIVIVGRPRARDGKPAGEQQVYVRRMDSFEFEPLKGTEGALGVASSPDGKWLAFISPAAPGTTRKRLMKIPVDGSAPAMALADWSDAWQGLVWLESGDFITTDGKGEAIVRISAADGKALAPVKIDAGAFQGTFVPLRTLPEDRGLLAQVTSYSPRGFEIGVGLIDPGTGKAKILVENGGAPSYMPPGKLLFARADTLLAAPFDLDSLEVTGGPVAILGGLRTENSWAPGGFSYTRDGTLGYVPGGMVGAKRRIAIADRSGKVEPWSEERRSFETWPVLSRDGRRVAVVITNPNAIYEIWISDRDRPALRRLVAAADADCYAPVWSPEADRIAYGRVAKNDLDGIYLQAADGAAPPRRIFRPASPADQYLPWQWTPDGSGIVMIRQSAGKADVVLLPVPKGTGETAQAKPLLASAFNEVDPAISPDGRWLAYASDESGRFEVYVVPFRADGAAGAATPVSREGGARPRWAADGRTLYYASDKNVLMSVAVPDRSAAAFAAPAPVLDLEPLRISAPRAAFDVLPDGRLVIIQKGEEEDELRRFNLVLNWSAELAKRMPAAR